MGHPDAQTLQAALRVQAKLQSELGGAGRDLSLGFVIGWLCGLGRPWLPRPEI